MTPQQAYDRITQASDGVRELAAKVRQTQGLSLNYADMFRTRYVAGQGLIDTRNDTQDAEDDGEEQDPLVGDEEGGSVYEDDSRSDGESEQASMDEEDDDYSQDGDMLSPTTAKWLNGLAQHIRDLHGEMPPGFPVPCPHLSIEPKPHQYRALGMIERSRDSAQKGLLIADPPGLGKTLISMMAMVKASISARRFSIAVVPSSCVDQWRAEFNKFFVSGAIRVFVLRDSTVPASKLMDYDVIITSYAFVMNQYRKRTIYLNKIAKIKQSGTGLPPSRPNLSLFSEIFRWNNTKAPYLVLDEVNAIKNPRSLTFSAIEELRSLADTCVMLSGSPLDNTWQDIFAFLQLLKGHNIRSKRKMLYLLGTPDTKRPGRFRPPTAQRFLRLVQIMNGFTVRRPETMIELPPLVEVAVTFTLDETEAAASNAEYEKYKRSLRSNALDNVHGAASRGAKTSALPAEGSGAPEDLKGLQFLHLTRALQYACHPKLVQIMRFARIEHATGLHHDSASADILEDPAAIAAWTSWRETLKLDDNWISSRIIAVIDSFNKRRDLDPSCSVIIFDESVYFLDIIEIAFAAMYEPASCLRYDGRQAPDKRDRILEEFKMAAGSKVLLMSRATGGLGLNITSANVVILCSPWWKKEWEIQALKRVHRTGQERTVHLITISAANCNAERYKAKTRDRKHDFNSKVVGAITRRDEEAPRVWDNFR